MPTSWRALGSVSSPTSPHVGGTKNPDIAAIVALAPDLVVLDREENRLEDAERLTAAGLDLFVSDVRTVADAVQRRGRPGGRVGRPSPRRSTSATAEPDVDAVGVRPDLAAAVDVDQRFDVRRLAARPSRCRARDGRLRRTTYPEVELDDIRALRPSAVLVPSEPYDFEDRHLAELAAELRRDDDAPLPVVRIDGQDLFWWGIRTPAAIERLRALIGRCRAAGSSAAGADRCEFRRTEALCNTRPMARTTLPSGIEIEYDTFGDPPTRRSCWSWATRPR